MKRAGDKWNEVYARLEAEYMNLQNPVRTANRFGVEEIIDPANTRSIPIDVSPIKISRTQFLTDYITSSLFFLNFLKTSRSEIMGSAEKNLFFYSFNKRFINNILLNSRSSLLV